ncbi:MAG: hypothetical protein ACJ8FY_26205 [Gemmataceae bacterium]
MREILECGNSRPFRPYYDWVADEVLKAVEKGRIKCVAEYGAGTAPISRRIAKDPRSAGLRLIVCDSNPDLTAYTMLKGEHPEKVFPLFEPVDFKDLQNWDSGTLVFLSAALHHVPHQIRNDLIKRLRGSASRIMVFEPLRKDILSVLFVILSLIPALLLPVWFINRPGALRRVVYCWVLPVAPFMFLWDGFVSCLRQWTEFEWKEALPKTLGRMSENTLNNSLFCQSVSW